MKTVLQYGILLGMLLFPALSRADDLGVVRLSLIQGDVQVLIRDTTDWTPATINLPLNEHDRLWVPDGSRAELQIRGGVYARVDENTGFDILTLRPDSAQFYLDRGHVYVSNRNGGMNTVQVDTPMTSVRSYDNSVFMIAVAEDGVHEISVLKGVVYAESRAGATRVNAGSTLVVLGEGNAQLSPVSAPGEWEQWNVDRDRELAGWTESSRYLPDELQQYSSELDRNGRWDYVPDYGYAWFPTVAVSHWAPYSFGNWVWIRGNYIWVDYHPWGWVPFHYGRWVFIDYRGWCWVPPAMGAVYWSPGYVGWIVTPSYIAWVPLAPGEIYYGYGYYGPGSVNITTVNINAVVVNRTYRNARIKNSVVVAKRETFGTGRRDPVRVRENPFQAQGRTRDKVKIVPPRTRPEKPVTIAPPGTRDVMRRVPPEQEQRGVGGPRQRTVGETPPAASGTTQGIQRGQSNRPEPTVRPRLRMPPERVLRNRPETFKNERPLVRQREGSAFRSQPPDNLPVTKSRQPRRINRPPAPAPQEETGAVRKTPPAGPSGAPQQPERRPQRSLQGRQR